MSPDRARQSGNVSDVDPHSFGGQLRRLREDAGMTQTELANALGTKQGRVSEYELNKHLPSEETIVAIAHILNVPAARLFETSRWSGAIPVHPERRERLRDMNEKEWRLFDQFWDAQDDLTPEDRARFERGFARFLETWQKD